jgi:hypothetical protein
MPSGSPQAGHRRHCRCCHPLAVVKGGVADSVGDCTRFLPRLLSRTYTRCSCIMFASLHSTAHGRWKDRDGKGVRKADPESTAWKLPTVLAPRMDLRAAHHIFKRRTKRRVRGLARRGGNVEALCSTASAVCLLVLSTGTPGKKIADFSGGMPVQRYWGQQCINPLQQHQKAVEHHSLHLPSEALAQPCTIG